MTATCGEEVRSCCKEGGGKGHFFARGVDAGEGKISSGVGAACCGCAAWIGWLLCVLWGRQKGKVEQIRGWLLVNIQGEKSM